MKRALLAAGLLLIVGGVRAEENPVPADAEAFVKTVVKSLVEDGGEVTFAVADQVFAMDNGEVLPRDDLRKMWPELARRSVAKKVSTDEFFRDVRLEIVSPREKKRLMSNERVMAVYKYREGDLYCDASRARDGVESPVKYEKAFQYIIRKIDGRWTLIGLGG